MKNIIIILALLATSFSGFAQITGTDTTKKNIADTLKKDLFTAPDTVQHLRSKALRYYLRPHWWVTVLLLFI